jgi:hypothetical protein
MQQAASYKFITQDTKTKQKHTNITAITKIIKVESIYKINLNAKLKGLVEETKWSN